MFTNTGWGAATKGPVLPQRYSFFKYCSEVAITEVTGDSLRKALSNVKVSLAIGAGKVPIFTNFNVPDSTAPVAKVLLIINVELLNTK